MSGIEDAPVSGTAVDQFPVLRDLLGAFPATP
jgi:hypothetical protein